MMKTFVLLFVIISTTSFALETSNIEFRDGSTNDDTTRIYRENNSLMFDDAETTSPVSLATILNQRTSHDALENLTEDDHPQYLNQARHSTTHSSTFNRGLSIGLDHNNNATLGAHVDDGDIHLKRDASEIIDGAWTFEGDLTVNQERLTIEDLDTLDSVGINFTTSTSTGSFFYDVIQGYFTMDSPLLANDLNFNNGDGNKLALETSLLGYSGGLPGAYILGFSSVEGIPSDELLSSAVDESITGSWNFLDDVDVQVTTNSSAFADQAVHLDFESSMTGTGSLDGRQRTGLLLDHDASFDSAATMDDMLYAGLKSNMLINSALSGSPAGLGIGVLGSAESDQSSLHVIGVAGITKTSTSGVNRVGILGADSDSILTDFNSIPDGNHAGVFFGDVYITDNIAAQTVAFVATIESGSSITSGDVVEWGTTGQIKKATASTVGTSAYAGVALETGSSLQEIKVAFGGIVELSTTAAVTAGQEVTWNGTQLIGPTGSDVRFVGTALNSHAGGSSGNVKVQINLDFER